MAAPQRLCLIANPQAGGGRTRRAVQELEVELESRSVDFDLVWTRDAQQVPEVAQESASTGRLPVVVGGDGTVAAAACALVGTDAPLGIVPGGRGNDLARALGIPKRPREALGVVLRGTTKRIDIGEANGRRFVGIASLGFDSDANRLANEARFLRGSLVYAYAAFRALGSWRPARFQVTIDGDEQDYEGWSVAVANNGIYGGGMKIAPTAELDDQLLDVVMISGTSKLRFARMLPRIYRGAHVDAPEVAIRQSTSVEVRADRAFTVYADGDALCDLPMRVRVIPAAISIITP